MSDFTTEGRGLDILMLLVGLSTAVYVGADILEYQKNATEQLREICQERRPNTSFHLTASSDIHCQYEDGEIYPKHHAGLIPMIGEILHTATIPIKMVFQNLMKHPFWGSIALILTFFYTAQFVRMRRSS